MAQTTEGEAMRKRSRIRNLSLCLGGFAVAGIAQRTQAQSITVDGTLDAGYGSAISTQTIQTGFGDSTSGDGNSTQGSELDAAYGTIQNNTLYLFFSGNFEAVGQHVDVFIADQRAGGQNVLNATAGPMSNMNGSTFSPGFNATYMVDVNDYYGTLYANKDDLTTGQAGYDGSVSLSGGIGHGTGTSGIMYGLNNINAAGIGGDSGVAADQTAADAVSTGLELGIPLGLLGNPTSVKVLADINAGGNGNDDGYLSNQFLPGLPVGTNNLGAGGTLAGPNSGAFNLSTLTGEYFTVTAPAPANGIWAYAGGGSWGDSTKWSNSYVPSTAADSASFATATATSTITLDGARTISSLSFNDPSASYIIAPGTGGSLTLAANGSNLPTIQDFAGVHTISAPVTLNANTTVSLSNTTDTLTISGNINGVGGLTASDPAGGSNVVLSGNNSYGGGTTVLAGNLQLGSSTALPTGTALTLSALDVPSGVLDLNGNSASVSSITVLTGPQTAATGSTAQIINTSATAGTATLTYAGSNASPSAPTNFKIADNSGSGGGTTALTVASGSLTLGGNNTYGGTTTINNGATLVLNYSTGIALPTGGNVANNGSLSFTANNANGLDPATAGNISGSGTTTVNGVSLTAVNLSQGALVNNGAVTVGGTGTVGPISGTGNLTVNGTLHLATNSGGSTQTSLTLGGSGVLDIANNHFTIATTAGDTSSTDPIYPTLIGWLNDGQITSTTGYTSPNYGVGMVDGNDGVHGSPVSANEIEMAYTLEGDANLDGKVDASDFSIFAPNFGLNTTLGWEAGDFNYDGKVDASDFSAFAPNFGLQDNGVDLKLPAADYAALDAFAAANGLTINPVSVPEPASLAMIVMGGFGILRRRRRN
jgi:autotransporter-associated beta strand protein